MSKGTIVYIGGFEMPDKNAAAHRVLNNAKVLSEIGYHIVFCGIDKQIATTSNMIQKIETFDSIPSKYPTNFFEWFYEMVSFKHIKEVIEMYSDVKYVIAYNMHAIPLQNLLRYSKKHQIMVIADVTEWYENNFSLFPVKFVKWYDTKKVMTNLQKKVDGIISISGYLTEYYKNSVKNIVQIPPLVDLNETLWNEPIYQKKDCIEFVYTGVPGRDKDRINSIIDAFYYVKDLNFIFYIVGITKEQFLVDYPEYRKKLEKLHGKVVFKGRVSHKDSIDSLYIADYCIFLREKTRKNMAGFPTKFAECISTGVGVIVNDFSNIKDYFPRENSYLVELENDCLIEILTKLINTKKVIHNKEKIFDYRQYINNMKNFMLNFHGE